MTGVTGPRKSGDPSPDQQSELDEETVVKRTENIIGELCENKDLKVQCLVHGIVGVHTYVVVVLF